ncbi:MAG TPA: DUF1501 domain-containing protein [Pirellulales bacterium]|nr:DUF1501 domain-containing protein [Pirellulales bacterium]
MTQPRNSQSNLASRRQFFSDCGLSLGGIALAALMENQGRAAAPQPPRTDPLAVRPPHFAPRAKAVIQLFMAGGPSQLELFDNKPKLNELNGQSIPPSYTDGKRFAFIKPDAKLLGCRRKFTRHGQSGNEISELLPHTAALADDLAILRTMKTDVFNHGPAKMMLATGTPQFGRPSMGSWVLYALGNESHDLPGFVVLKSGPRGPRSGAALWGNAFLSSVYQGVPLRNSGDPILNLTTPPGVTSAQQRRTIEAIGRLNRERLAATGDDEIATRIASYEMAERMQGSAPELVDLAGESAETLALYGAEPGKASFANNCLLARRLVERGVRFVTLFHTEWDHHGGTENLEESLENICQETDRPTAALVSDLKRRGMLDDTLVVWGGEFGRTPMGEDRGSLGRDHHIEAYTMWLAGGGIRAGQTIGTTDELGFGAAEPHEQIHVHDLQATILHLLGLDHLRLTYRFQGRDFRLTDVGGQLIRPLLG